MQVINIKKDRNGSGVVFFINGKVGFIDKKYRSKKAFESKLLDALDGSMTIDATERIGKPYLYIQDLPILKIISEKKVYFLEPIEENWFFGDVPDIKRSVKNIDFNNRRIEITVPMYKQLLVVKENSVIHVPVDVNTEVVGFEDVVDPIMVNNHIESKMDSILKDKYTIYRLYTVDTSVYEKYIGFKYEASTDNIIKYITNNGLVDNLVDAFITQLDREHILNSYKYEDNALNATITALNPMTGEMETCEVTYTIEDVINNIDIDTILNMGYPHVKEEGWIKDLI